MSEQPPKIFEDIENKDGEKILIESMRKIAEIERADGIPVDDKCRVIIEKFEGGVYPKEKILKDKNDVENHKRNWESDGTRPINAEKLEMLITYIFHEFMGDKFNIARTSEYDDFEHGVDNIFSDKETGETIFGVDGVSVMSGPIYEKKRDKVLKMDKDGGAEIEYGFKASKDGNGVKRIELEGIKGVPILYLSLSEEILNEAIRSLGKSIKERGDYSKKIFNYFAGSLINQIDGLELIKSRLDRKNSRLFPALANFRTLLRSVVEQK